VRARLSAFVAGNREAQKRVSAARALDRVLDFAPRLSDAQTAALAQRIVARAAHQPRIVAKSDVTPSRHWLRQRGNHGVAAAALAASLMIGVLAGQNTAFATLTDAIVGGTGTISSAAGQQVAQGDEADALLDEDLL
jgi:negative regulator of sigma E activity